MLNRFCLMHLSFWATSEHLNNTPLCWKPKLTGIYAILNSHYRLCDVYEHQTCHILNFWLRGHLVFICNEHRCGLILNIHFFLLVCLLPTSIKTVNIFCASIFLASCQYFVSWWSDISTHSKVAVSNNVTWLLWFSYFFSVLCVSEWPLGGAFVCCLRLRLLWLKCEYDGKQLQHLKTGVGMESEGWKTLALHHFTVVMNSYDAQDSTGLYTFMHKLSEHSLLHLPTEKSPY